MINSQYFKQQAQTPIKKEGNYNHKLIQNKLLIIYQRLKLIHSTNNSHNLLNIRAKFLLSFLLMLKINIQIKFPPLKVKALFHLLETQKIKSFYHHAQSTMYLKDKIITIHFSRIYKIHRIKIFISTTNIKMKMLF